MSTAPRPWAVRGVELAVLLLPAGRVRDRYRQELVAELWGTRPARQLQHVLSVLASAPALRRALVEAGKVEFRHTRVWCVRQRVAGSMLIAHGPPQ